MVRLLLLLRPRGDSVAGSVPWCSESHRFESHYGCSVRTLSKFLTHNALHYNCICTVDARKCTSELGMHKEEGNSKDRLYCIVLLIIVIIIVIMVIINHQLTEQCSPISYSPEGSSVPCEKYDIIDVCILRNILFLMTFGTI